MTIHFSLFSDPYPQLTPHYPRFTNQQLTNYEPLPTTTTHYFFIINTDNILCFTPSSLFVQQVHQHATWWVASFFCRVFFSLLFCIISTTQAHGTFTQHPPNQRMKKAQFCFFFSNSTLTILSVHNSTNHNAQLAIQNSQLITPHKQRQRVLLHALSPLRPTSSHLMNRKFFLCLSRVFRLFLHCSASSRQHKRKPHSYNTLSNQRVKKNLLTYNSQITASCSLLKTHCSVLISHFSTTHCSQFTTHSTQLTTHSSLLTSNEDNVLCFTPFYLFFVQQVHQHVTWWIASFSFACRVWFVSSLFCLISISQTHAIFIQHPSHQRVEKKKLTTHPTANYSLFTTCNSLCTTQYYLLIDYCSLIKATCSLLPAHNSLLTTHCSLFTYLFLYTHHSPSTIFLTTHSHCSLLNTYDLQLITQYLLFTTDNALLATHHSLHFFLLLTTHYPLPIIRILVNHNSRFTTHH